MSSYDVYHASNGKLKEYIPDCEALATSVWRSSIIILFIIGLVLALVIAFVISNSLSTDSDDRAEKDDIEQNMKLAKRTEGISSAVLVILALLFTVSFHSFLLHGRPKKIAPACFFMQERVSNALL
ncbi:hypothetical protein KP791_000076 [Venturia canescens]|uniref:Uncharacterized protein n=2 Tax=Venturia canescens TaxID=32260 RepID=A0ACB9ZJD6_9HYME|nr:uncharacterized LOC122408212 [Venturia canescens]AJZ73119.1 hypothetical protein [Venturia canescens]KAI5630589.1 hypothetical protein KP791_000076 [Venturia canescens]